ncbi:hypothetical protein ACIRVN_15515 [Streptomyces albogriseolus]|uniref:hypothetical protein n=1 Tax=Streptomyces albogriseolus TaxID=1887 RepID=UPI0038167022
MDAEMRDLLAVVLEALDIPHPATAGGAEVYDRIRGERATHVVVALRSVLDDRPLMGVEWTTDYLREQLAKRPAVGYVTVAQAHAELAKGKTWSEAVALPVEDGRCGRCRRPFDPRDTRFDGHARYKETPFCGSCIDNCHEGSAEHVCRICDPARYGGGQR